MEVLQFGDGGREARPGAGFADLVDCIGAPSFGPTLFRISRERSAISHLTAFAVDGDRPPVLLVAQNAGVRKSAATIAHRYLQHYWALDLASTVRRSEQARPKRQRWALLTSAKDIDCAEYREDCYTSACLDQRLSLIESQGNTALQLNFYHSGRTPISRDVIDRSIEAADLLFALLRQHNRLCDRPRQPATADAIEFQLKQVAPSLSARERQVCALIAFGVTSEGIALRLGVGLNSVLTYRKRAYGRLGICSQNELMRLLFR